MSTTAQDLIELLLAPAGALTQIALRKLALNLIAPGVADTRGGC